MKIKYKTVSSISISWLWHEIKEDRRTTERIEKIKKIEISTQKRIKLDEEVKRS